MAVGFCVVILNEVKNLSCASPFSEILNLKFQICDSAALPQAPSNFYLCVPRARDGSAWLLSSRTGSPRRAGSARFGAGTQPRFLRMSVRDLFLLLDSYVTLRPALAAASLFLNSARHPPL